MESGKSCCCRGDEVQKISFSVGDRVFTQVQRQRAGSNQEYQLVDERIAALAPKNLSDEESRSAAIDFLLDRL